MDFIGLSSLHPVWLGFWVGRRCASFDDSLLHRLRPIEYGSTLCGAKKMRHLSVKLFTKNFLASINLCSRF
jgi:hypothetical protein